MILRQFLRVAALLVCLLAVISYPLKFGTVTELGAAENAGESSLPEEQDEEYLAWVEEWHSNRIERLNDDQGWLRLAGLYWLDEGEQLFGSGERARVRFPEGSIPEYAGIFELRSDSVFIRVVGNVDIRDNRGRGVREELIYPSDERKELQYRTLTWFVVQRDDKFGIRLYDDNSPHLRHFDGIDRFEVDRKYRVEADFDPHEEGATMMIENVLGQMIEWDVAGTLMFSLDDQEISMVALGTGDRLFIPFADATTGDETYPGGRFVYIDRPSPGEPAVIDFNVSYNPPCAINPHTTCPLPPPQNRLNVAIRAGEKHYEMYREEE
ncbi:DUF1684 domain-containing protein [Balneolales bacterium ANBcel1]|nr:DUF1684 domain-containing protein [Balneolales bacterium ANBcel1]